MSQLEDTNSYLKLTVPYCDHPSNIATNSQKLITWGYFKGQVHKTRPKHLNPWYWNVGITGAGHCRNDAVRQCRKLDGGKFKLFAKSKCLMSWLKLI